MSMFDDEEDEDQFSESYLSGDIERFNAYLIGGERIGFLDSDRWEALVDHYLIQGLYNNAFECTQEALTQFSYNDTFKIRGAQALSALGKLKEAINILNKIEKEGMETFELYLTKASIFSQLKDSKNAIKHFTSALNLASDEDKDEIYLDLALEYENRGDFNAALKILKEAIAYNPSNEGAIYEIAFCYDQLGEFEKSIQCYTDFIDDNPYSFTAWYNLGNAYLRVEDYEKANWAYDYCTLINGDFGPVYYNIGHALLSLDKFEDALVNFKKCIELDGDDPVAYCYIGECHEQLGDLVSAKVNYKKSLELAPLLPDAWLGLGIVADLEGNTKEGITLILKAAELDPENAGIYHVLAGAYEKLENDEEAIRFYQLSLNIDPKDPDCLSDYVLLLKDSSLVLALERLEQFISEHSVNAIALILKVDLLWQLQRSEEALSLFKLCLEEDRKNAQKLFEINPALKSVPEFVLLGD